MTTAFVVQLFVAFFICLLRWWHHNFKVVAGFVYGKTYCPKPVLQ